MPATDEPILRPGGPRVLAAVLWSLLVGVLLLTPGDRLPQRGAPDWLDKPVHAGLFALHCLALAEAVPGGRRRALRAAVLGSAVYAAVCELLQLVVAGRSWSVWDLVAGWLGIAVAAAFLARRRATLGPDLRA